MLLFSSLNFIIWFLPIFLFVYYLAPVRKRSMILLLGSLVFYAMGAGWYILVLLAATGCNWLLAAWTGGRERKRWVLVLTLILDVSVLCVFKILGTFVSDRFLPVGISFYLFRMIAFQVELYRGTIPMRPGLEQTAVYFCMFPQLLSGPIARYGQMQECVLGQGTPETESRWQFLTRIGSCLNEGLVWFVLGLSMKVLLADHFAGAWHRIGSIGYASISPWMAWFGAVIYSLELYFDFWGYSLMAAGIGVMLGYPFIRNFDHPYAAHGAADFYRRWHMTLGTWFRDLIYIPMGGSRGGMGKTFRNLAVVWLLTGLWHGLTWNYLCWSACVLGMILLEKLMASRIRELERKVHQGAPEDALAQDALDTPRRMWEELEQMRLLQRILHRVHVWIGIPLTWVMFAIPDLKQLGLYFSRLFPFFGTGIAVNRADALNLFSGIWGYLLVGLILLFPASGEFLKRHRNENWFLILLLGLLGLSLYSMAGSSGNPFLYLQF